MNRRLAFAFPALSACLLIGATAAACTTTVIEQHAAPPPAEEAGATNPGTPEPMPEAGVDSEVPKFVFKPAPEGTFAQAVSFGGSVVKAPKLVPIIFQADVQKQTIIDFSTKLAKSTYWGQITAEYGVGALTTKPAIILAETAPPSIDDEQIGLWLAQKFNTDPTRFGLPDSDTLYAIYYPDGTTVTQGGGAGCSKFGGYHFETNAGKSISYAVIPRCATFGGLGGADVTTYSSSHEILEWATDPFPASRPAYMTVDNDHAVWGKVFLGELGDLCTPMGDVAVTPADLGFTVQRTWSNASAKAGHHPCAPVGKAPYFTAFPAKLDAIQATDEFGRPITTRGLQVGVGQSKTIELTMYSDAAMGTWTVQVIDLTRMTGGEPEFSYKLDKSKGTSGDKLQLTITGEKPAFQGKGFLIISQTQKDSNLFPVTVTN